MTEAKGSEGHTGAVLKENVFHAGMQDWWSFIFSIILKKTPQSLMERHESDAKYCWVAELYGNQNHPSCSRIHLWKIILLQGHASTHRTVPKILVKITKMTLCIVAMFLDHHKLLGILGVPLRGGWVVPAYSSCRETLHYSKFLRGLEGLPWKQRFST